MINLELIKEIKAEDFNANSVHSFDDVMAASEFVRNVFNQDQLNILTDRIDTLDFIIDNTGNDFVQTVEMDEALSILWWASEFICNK